MRLPFSCSKRALFSAAFITLAFIAILALSWYERVLLPFANWSEGALHVFGRPNLTNLDGFFYLRMVEAWLAGTYPIDPLRLVPEGENFPSTIPLLPFLTALAHQVSGIGYQTIAVYATPVISSLLCFSLFLFYRTVDQRPTFALLAALIGTFMIYWLLKTKYGFYDLDSLKLPLTFLSGYFCYALVKTRRFESLYYALAWCSLILFSWWWFHAVVVALAISGVPMFLALCWRIDYVRTRRFVYLTLAGFVLLLLLQGISFPITVWQNFLQWYTQLVTPESDLFSTTPIAELLRLNWASVIRLSFNNVWVFYLSLFGLAALIVKGVMRDRALIVAFAMPLFMSALTYFAGRFIIYFNMVLAVSLVYALSLLYDYTHLLLNALVEKNHTIKQWNRKSYAVVPIVLAACLPLYISAVAVSSCIDYVKASGYSFLAWGNNRSYLPILENTPFESVIWAIPRDGHQISYYTKRATLSDPDVATDRERNFFIDSAWNARSQREAANMIKFYVAHGLEGMRVIYEQFDGDKRAAITWLRNTLAQSPEQTAATLATENLDSSIDWLKFLYPPYTRDVFLLIDEHTFIFPSWFFSGQLYGEAKQSDASMEYYQRLDGNQDAFNARGVWQSRQYNLHQLRSHPAGTALARIVSYANGQETVEPLNPNGAYQLLLNWDYRYGVLTTNRRAESVFMQLGVLNQYEYKYFAPVVFQGRRVQLWKVGGDVVD